MNITMITEKDSPKISKIKEKYGVISIVSIKDGKLKIVEFFNKDGIFRGFGKTSKMALKKAKKALKSYYAS